MKKEYLKPMSDTRDVILNALMSSVKPGVEEEVEPSGEGTGWSIPARRIYV